MLHKIEVIYMPTPDPLKYHIVWYFYCMCSKLFGNH